LLCGVLVDLTLLPRVLLSRILLRLCGVLLELALLWWVRLCQVLLPRRLCEVLLSRILLRLCWVLLRWVLLRWVLLHCRPLCQGLLERLVPADRLVRRRTAPEPVGRLLNPRFACLRLWNVLLNHSLGSPRP
jgi:hypothetical protein